MCDVFFAGHVSHMLRSARYSVPMDMTSTACWNSISLLQTIHHACTPWTETK